MEETIFYAPSKVYLSFGALKNLREVKSAIGSRLILVTEKKLLPLEGFRKVQDAALDSGIELVVFSDIGRDTTSYSVIEAAKLAKASKAQGIAGFGGIRALSVAKAVSAAAGYNGNFYNLFSGPAAPFTPLPYIEIPGVPRNPFMLSDMFSIVDARNGRLKILSIKNSQPEYVIMDPEVYSSLTRQFRISILLDALMESIEGYFSRNSNYISDTFMLKAISLIVSLLPRLKEDPENPDNYLKAAEAGLSSAMGLSRGISGLGTACAFEIDRKFGAPHSAAAAVLLPYIMEYGLKINPDKISRMGPILGENIKGLSVVAAADRVIETLRASIGGVNLPGRLSELGMKEGDIVSISERVMDYPMISTLETEVSVEYIYDFLKEAL